MHIKLHDSCLVKWYCHSKHSYYIIPCVNPVKHYMTDSLRRSGGRIEMYFCNNITVFLLKASHKHIVIIVIIIITY